MYRNKITWVYVFCHLVQGTKIYPTIYNLQFTFGSIKEVEFTSKSLNVKTKHITKVENNTREIKHDPNKYLMNVKNTPSDLSVESFVLNSDPRCMFRECDMCGVNKLNSQFIAQNPNIW